MQQKQSHKINKFAALDLKVNGQTGKFPLQNNGGSGDGTCR